MRSFSQPLMICMFVIFFVTTKKEPEPQHKNDDVPNKLEYHKNAFLNCPSLLIGAGTFDIRRVLVQAGVNCACVE